MSDKSDTWICRKCGKPLETQKVVFVYMGHTFSHDVPKCPQCGSVMISSQLADGKITEVETMLEDK